MTTVQSFGTSLLTPQVKTPDNAQAPSVEEVLNNTPAATIPEQAPDTFTKSDTPQNPQPAKGGSLLKRIIIGAVVIVAAFFVGRSKYVKGLFRGKLSAKDMYKKIEEKMAEYLNVGENGKVNIVKNDDGTSTLKATFSSGQIREYSVKDGNNVVKLKGKFPDCRLEEEFIVFDKKTGSPRFRVNLSRMDGSQKVKEYISYKGTKILDKDFDEITSVYKEYSKGKPSRNFVQNIKHALGAVFGFRSGYKVESLTSIYKNPTTGKAIQIKKKAHYNKDGKLEKIEMAREGKERTIHIGENGKVSSIRTETQDGKVAIEKFQYTTTPEGKIKIDKVDITDEAGNPTAPIKWSV